MLRPLLVPIRLKHDLERRAERWLPFIGVQESPLCNAKVQEPRRAGALLSFAWPRRLCRGSTEPKPTISHPILCY